VVDTKTVAPHNGRVTHPGAAAPWPAPAGPGGAASAAKAHRWFVVYTIAMAVLYLLLVAGGLFLALADLDLDIEGTDTTQLKIQGIVMVFTGLGLGALFAAAPFVPRKPWAWIYGLVLIGLGLGSCRTWPFTIPLIIQWLKPDMKAWYGRT